MQKTAIGFVLLAALLMTCAGISAQTSDRKMPVTTSTPDLSKLNVEKILQQLQTTKPQVNADETSPLQVVAEFLQLTPSQVTELGQLLQSRQAKLVPLVQAAQALTHSSVIC